MHGSPSKGVEQALTVALATEQLNHSSKEILHCPGRVSGEKIGHAKHLERFSHALYILLRFKQTKRLLVRLKSLLNSACVLQPVAQTVETPSAQRWVSKFLCQRKRLAEPHARPFVIVSGPQKPEGCYTLPFHFAIMNCASVVEHSLVITTRALKVAKCFIGLPAQAIDW